eukprot:TRINITY_DN25525_c0_g1_i1.p1 TRINITY_DN25525_c0_g1~~TRINITY_DN25525_c0_g1_i1.p1  ORF type:complete len:576 (-),score=115.96 TRINITY_DN25525_c0_g1_i1:120-1847(-)
MGVSEKTAAPDNGDAQVKRRRIEDKSKEVAAAIEAFRNGRHVIVADGQGGCSLALPAQHATAERIAFMLRHSSGIVNAAADSHRLEAFGMHPTIHGDGRALYVAVDFGPGCTTGVSAKDRAATLQALCNVSNSAAAFIRPGHTFPSCVEGVLKKPSRPDAAYELCRLAELHPVAALVEMMKEDGEPHTGDDATAFGRQHDIPFLSVELLADLIRQQGDLSGPSKGPVEQTKSKMWVDDIKDECWLGVYSCSDPTTEIVAVVKGNMEGKEGVPVRIHSECFTGDVLASRRCDCGQQLHRFMKIMNDEELGVLIYIRGHEGRGIGLEAKIRAYKLQDEGHDTVDANLKLGLPVDTRQYSDALGVLKQLGLKSVRLYTNNPEKMRALMPITKEVVALASIPSDRNMGYLKTKRERLNHRTVLDTFKLPVLNVPPTKAWKVGIVYTTWNSYYVDELKQKAEAQLGNAGATCVTMAVPGACELISGARAILRQHKPDAVIAIGVLIRGNSDLYDATCNAVMSGLTELNAAQDTPIVLGVLMCRDEEQASERSHGAGNPAKAWADTALHMASISAKSSPSP